MSRRFEGVDHIAAIPLHVEIFNVVAVIDRNLAASGSQADARNGRLPTTRTEAISAGGILLGLNHN
jgi:hypothetical protein